MAHFCQRTYQPTGETFQAFVPTTIGVDFKFDVAQIKAFTALDQLISDSQLAQDKGLGACPRTATDLRESRFETDFAFFLGE
jgi:hypothetical protein